MRVVSERVATPREIAAEIDEPLNNVAYHLKVLVRLGCIELVKVKQTRGGRVAEHFYKATQRPFWNDADWERLGEAEKLGVTTAIMQQISEDIAVAMSHGTFNEPDDNHISRSPMIVDEDGWYEMTSLLEQTTEALLAIQRKVDERSDGTEETMHTKVEIIQFRSPTPKLPPPD